MAGLDIAANIAGQAVGGLLNEGLGINRRQDERQLKQQQKLNEQAAALNYEYGEKAAQNSFQRSMDMYNREFVDNLPANQRKRLEEAGLSVGLMYGGAGSTGGANVGQMAQGPTGGAQAGNAANAAEQEANAINRMGMALQMQKLDSEVKVNESIAEKNRASAGRDVAETLTTEGSRNIFIENLRNEGIAQWMQNNITRWQSENNAQSTQGEPLMEMSRNQTYNTTHTLRENAMINEHMAMQIAEAYTAANANAATAELTTERAKGYWTELLNATMHAEADQIRAAAAKLSTEWDTGEYTNWKTWADLASNVSRTIIQGVGARNIGKSKVKTK